MLKIKDNVDLKELEKYCPITNYEDLYLINGYGNIKSKDRKVKNNRGFRIIKGKMLKPKLDNHGYLKIGLTKNKQQKSYFIHRLVAMTFIPNPSEYPIVNHINGNKLDNSIDNLEWCDAKHNIEHAYATGLKKGISAEHKGIKNPKSKLTEKDVLLILDNKQKGIDIKDSYLLFEKQISFRGFEQIWYGYSWKHLVEKVEDSNV